MLGSIRCSPEFLHVLADKRTAPLDLNGVLLLVVVSVSNQLAPMLEAEARLSSSVRAPSQ